MQMTSAERDRLKKAVQDFCRDATASQEAAEKTLVATGIYTKSGRVSANYGGELAKKVRGAATGASMKTSAKPRKLNVA